MYPNYDGWTDKCSQELQLSKTLMLVGERARVVVYILYFFGLQSEGRVKQVL